MKKPSATKPSLSPPEHVFFTDRDLGKKFPEILRGNGLRVETYFEHFPHSDTIADSAWIEHAARCGFVALSRDNRIRRDPVAIKTVFDHRARLFVLRGVLTAQDRAAVFLAALGSISKLLSAQGNEAFIANVRSTALRGGEVKSTAEVMLSRRAWEAAGMDALSVEAD